MAQRLESTSGLTMGSNFLPLHEGSQPAGPAVAASRAELPQRYGIPLLELLVVDPQFIFISWEITQEQLDASRVALREDFARRRLQVVLSEAQSGAELAT